MLHIINVFTHAGFISPNLIHRAVRGSVPLSVSVRAAARQVHPQRLQGVPQWPLQVRAPRVSTLHKCWQSWHGKNVAATTPAHTLRALVTKCCITIYSGFSMLITGSSGSGKTTALCSMMMTKGKRKGKRTSYKNVFGRKYLVSRTLGNSSIKNGKLSTIPDDQIYREL